MSVDEASSVEEPRGPDVLRRALHAVKDLRGRLDAVERAGHEPIAVVGIGCRFPGGVRGPDAFWQLLRGGVDAITEVPPSRWDVDAYYDPDPAVPGKTYTRHGGFVDDVEQFDPHFFGISPREAASLDPQQRLLLEVTWEALEHAGIAPTSLAGSRTGVFVGISTFDYARLMDERGVDFIDPYGGTGGAPCVAAGRISYVLGLHGPTLAIDTACSSSLVAAHLACGSLRQRQSDVALAGGVNLMLGPHSTVHMAKVRALSPDGRCRTFDAAAAGYGRGEGCGIVVLKRLSDAEAAGDRIMALIRGGAIGHDGRKSGLTVPSGAAQQTCVRDALAAAGVEPAAVSYVEAHGTGTPLGDPIEVRALAGVLSAGRPADRPLLVGSVKTNIGHLEAAAGVSGLIKIVLSLHHGEIPPHLHLRNPSPHIDWSELPIAVPTTLQAWPPGPRIAGVSGFGFSGTNAHMILEAAPSPAAPMPPAAERPQHLLAMSARTELSLAEIARRYDAHLASTPETELADVCFSANVGRSHFSHRAAFVAASVGEAREKVRAFAAQGAASVRTTPSSRGRPKLAFLFTGQGAQYVSMGRELFETQPTFRRVLERCDQVLRPELDQSLLSVLYPESGAVSPIDETGYTQPALFSLEYALAELLRSWGVVPDVVLGHSVGEYAAACVAGVLELEDALRLIAARARLMQGLPRDGVMAAVFASEARVVTALATPAVAIAAVNGPEHVVISGERGAVAATLNTLRAQDVQSQPLAVSHAFHSPLMEPMLASFEAIAATVSWAPPRLGLVSNLTGQLCKATDVPGPDYWRRHAREPVRFAEGMQTLGSKGYEIFVEIGPQPTLLGMGRRCLPDGDRLWLPALRKGKADWTQLLETMAALYGRGGEIDWAGFDRDYPRRRLSLPTYPFERQRYWMMPVPAGRAGGGGVARRAGGDHPLLGRRLPSPLDVIQFEAELTAESAAHFEDHVLDGSLLFPTSAYVEMALGAAIQVLATRDPVLERIEVHDPLVLPVAEAVTVQVLLAPGEAGTATFRILSLDPHDRTRSTWRLHVTGRARRAAPSDDAEAPALAGVQARCTDELELTTGRLFIEAGGATVPRLGTIRRGQGEALARLRDSADPNGVGRPAPGLLDAAMQLFGPVLEGRAETAGDNQIYRPASVGFVRVPDGGRGAVWAHARMRSEDRSGPGFEGDVVLLDEAGRVVGEMRQVSLRPIPRAALALAQHSRTRDWMYEPVWQPAPRVSRPAPSPREGVWVVLVDHGGVGEAIARGLEVRGQRCVRVRPGPAYHEDSGSVTLDPTRVEDFERLLGALAEEQPVRGLVHAWSIDAPPLDGTAVASLRQTQARDCGSLLALVQAIARRAGGEPPQLCVMTRGAAAVTHPGSDVAVAAAPLTGLADVVAIEHPELGCLVVDLDPAASDPETDDVLTELLDRDREGHVAFRGGLRHVRRVVRWTGAGATADGVETRAVSSTTELDRVIEADATYLVTGGLGALGLHVAGSLVEAGARHLVLTGRRLPSAEVRQAVRRLEDAGARVHIAQADVASTEDMRRILAEIQRSGPPLRGLVHAAGVLDDGVLTQMSWERFQRVLAPKVEGAWNLHALTEQWPLRFFVLFSSVAALLGSPGQGNYTAANAFLDALAHHRRARGLPALSINWGAWGDTGMAATRSTRQQERAARLGVQSMEPPEALAVLHELLRGAPAQLAVMRVDWTRLLAQFPAGAEPPRLAALVEAVGERRQGPAVDAVPLGERLKRASDRPRGEVVGAFLLERACAVLGLSPSQLDATTPLVQLGLDSLMAVELKNRIERDGAPALPLARYLDGSDIDGLAGAMLDLLGEGPADGDRADAAELLARLPEMSESEIDSLLARMGGEGDER